MPDADAADDPTRLLQSQDDPTRLLGGSARVAQPRLRTLGPYTLVRLLGRGGMGEVWEAVDFRLDRRVALKVSTADPSPDAIERFRREATNSARLRHPRIVPVHDVGFDQGQQYLVMDLVPGVTLAEALRSGLLTYRRKAGILEQVARAVHYAHEQGIVHRDLKPANIMLESRPAGAAAGPTGASGQGLADDDFGEPLVMDFGLAKDLGGDSSLSRTGYALGTPSYMPPEQAEGRLDAVSARSDVWSLGAILYEMLTGRPPFTGESAMRVINAVVGEEPVPPRRISRDVPRDLETICLACLRKEPARRYASAEALADDLRAWLAGESISARPPTPLERSLKLAKRHRVAALVLTLALPTLVTLTLLYGEHLKELASWRTIASEDFADDGWSSRWRPLCGEFVRHEDGRVVSAKWGPNILAWPRKLLGPVAIEYEAEMLPDSPPCDISLVWARGLKDPQPQAAQGAAYPYYSLFDRPIELKIGAFDGSYTAIMINGQHVAYDPFKPVNGSRYRVRVEVVDNRVSICVDGRTLCAYTDPFPLTGGYACLFGFYPGKAFGQVRVQALSVPQKVPATAIGDAFAQDGEWQQGAEQYARVAAAHPGTAIAREAAYKQGLCEFRRGDRDAAFGIWRPLAGSEYDELVALHRLDVVADGGDLDRLLADLEELYRRATPDTRTRVALRWAECVRLDEKRDDHDDRTERLLELHDRVFPGEATVDHVAANCLLSLGRYQELLDRYPHQRHLCASALRLLHRDEEVAERYMDQRAICAQARMACGMFDRLAELGPDGEAFEPQAMIEQGRFEEMLAKHPRNALSGCALLMLGRLDEVASASPGTGWSNCAAIMSGRFDAVTGPHARPQVLVAQHRFEEVLNDSASTPGQIRYAQQCLAMQHAAAGDAASARHRFDEASSSPFGGADSDIDESLIIPLARELLGEDGAFARAAGAVVAAHRYDYMQCTWHAAMLALGRIDEDAFLAQPRRRFAQANRCLFSAIREERAGNRESARERYRAYLAAKPWERTEVTAILREIFAQWRIAALGVGR